MFNIDNNSLAYLTELTGGYFVAKQEGKACPKTDSSSGDYWIVKKGVPITIELVGSDPVFVDIGTGGTFSAEIVGYAEVTTRSPLTFTTYGEVTQITVSA